MTGPANARTGPGGIRIYSWTPTGPDGRPGEPVEVLSVTSIRKLTGESMNLVSWQIANVISLAMGTRRVTFVGPRGGVREKHVPDGEFPGEFDRRLRATKGDVERLAEVRRWLREEADEPRNVAAVRGSVVHKLIELNARVDQLSGEYITTKFEEQWAAERGRKIKHALLDDDIHFVRNCLRQYWDMRARVPLVILAAEPQVWNLTQGYAGSFDALFWFLGHHKADGTFVPLSLTDADMKAIRNLAASGEVTVETIKRVGGELVLGDWKTSKDTYPDHAVQITAYLAAEFVGTDNVIDERLTALLRAAMRGALVHIRPDKWSVEYIDFRPDVLRAFLGSCAFARFLAMHPTLENIVTAKVEGQAPDTDADAVGAEPSTEEDAA